VQVSSRLALLAAGAALALGMDHGPERSEIDTIVIHTIGGPSCSDEGAVQFRPVKGNAQLWKKWFEAEPVKGIHYIVDREGEALASIPEHQVANHAGNANKKAIGIELVNTGDGVDPFPAVQIDSLVTLLCDIAERNSLAASDIKGHADLETATMTCGDQETRRRVDPGALFPWQDVLERVEKCRTPEQAAPEESAAEE
jgi:N-acetylmuramoyl-L-alanine amidase